jgi:dolichol-phosphate mannosyltransferase
MSSGGKWFSLVVPVLNEEEVLPDTHATLGRVLEQLGLPFEVIVVDNGSTDQTPAVMRRRCAADPRWKYLRLSRNFGYQNSITAGMLAARGDAIMVVDADLQDPPELIPEFVARWQEGYDIVYGVRQKRVGETPLRICLTMIAMRLITWMSDDFKLPAHSGDFRLITRRVRDAFALMPESNRYVRGLIHWLGFRQLGIPYTRRGRTKGQIKARPLYLVGFAFNAIFTFSLKPLRLFSFLGLFVLGAAGLLAVLPLGLGAVVLLLLCNIGVVSLGIGVLGEYVAKVHAESKRRPLWLVDYTLNMGAPAIPRPFDPAAVPFAVLPGAREGTDDPPPRAAA